MDQFDPSIPNLIGGDVSDVAVVEPGGLGVSNLVIDPTKPFRVEITWEVYGPLTPLWFAALDPTWSIDVHAESMGGGTERLVGSATLSTATYTPTAKPFGREYKTSVTVAPNTLAEGNPGSNISGVYKLVAGVFLNSSLGLPGFDMAGYHEGPLIRAENPV